MFVKTQKQLNWFGKFQARSILTQLIAKEPDIG